MGRIVRVGVVAAIVVALGGRALERLRFGGSDRDAVARIETELRRQFGESAATLGRVAADLAMRRQAIGSTDRGTVEVRELFDAIDAALASQDRGRTGATIYDSLDTPVAWGGRTSELPPSRIGTSPPLFVAPGGPRLVRWETVIDRGRPFPARVATIVVEQQLGPVRSGPGDTDTVVISSTLVPVSLRVRVGDVAPQGPYTFSISAPGGGPLVDADVSPRDLASARTWWQNATRATLFSILALTLLFCAAAPLDRRRRATDARTYAATTVAILLAVGLARAVAAAATSSVLSGSPLKSSVDLLLTALALVVVVWLVLDTIERWRLAGPRPRLLLSAGESIAWVFLAYAAAGIATTAIVWFYERMLRGIVLRSPFDLLQFSLHPLDAARITLALGLVLLHAAVLWSAVATARLPSLWRTRRSFARRSAATVAWVAGVAVGILVVRARDVTLPAVPLLCAAAAVGVGSIALAHFRRRAGRASQAVKLWALFAALLVPALAMYPSLLAFVTEARERTIATEYGPQAARQRQQLQDALYAALDEIEGMRSIGALVSDGGDRTTPTVDRAFLVWSGTDLNVYRLTSAIELYGADGRLISRFALNLPDYASAPHKAAGCEWEIVDEVAPFGSSQRHVLRASRGICDHGEQVGSIVVSAMLDYRTLPFIESQSPYLESVQPDRQLTAEGAFGRGVEFATYGWSRVPTFKSGTSVWQLPDASFRRMVASRQAFWEPVDRDDVAFRVFFMNDRGGISAIGYPVITWSKHFVNIAELIVLVGVLYAALVLSMTPTRGRALLREIRSSFYRKLFLAFVAAAVVPVLILAFATRTYFTTQFEAEVKEAAARTATVAQRLIEDYATLQRGEATFAALDDQIMVLVQQAIDQDVNLFERSHLRATSARDLFASGLLPMRTPSEVYRRIVIDRMPTFVGEEEVISAARGDSRYLLAAAPVRAGEREGIVTVPVTLRRQETERKIDDLDHQVVSGAVLFSLLGAALGYWMAERVADPINRLTRATRRIARGNLDVRVAAATSDELGRLIRDFNRMAEDLTRQRTELERTQRLEAWADMARQVAHDIKNPLTPIQLSAEHAQRVNMDRGRPLSPVLDECVTAILSQVRLLRQIAAEFSSFASSATPHPAPTSLAELVEEVVGPYRVGLSGRIAIDVRVAGSLQGDRPGPLGPADQAGSLPPVHVDRTLLGRAVTNVIENALHAMPGAGTLSIDLGASASGDSVVIAISDTGVGMDPEALARIFEPYFSTKATGTGLGLTIAKRNVELNGGTVGVSSQKGAGTTVTITLPL